MLSVAADAVFSEQRVWLLILAFVSGTVGSYIPGRFRYYSMSYR